jgi:hypothetical protein
MWNETILNIIQEDDSLKQYYVLQSVQNQS